MLEWALLQEIWTQVFRSITLSPLTLNTACFPTYVQVLPALFSPSAKTLTRVSVHMQSFSFSCCDTYSSGVLCARPSGASADFHDEKRFLRFHVNFAKLVSICCPLLWAGTEFKGAGRVGDMGDTIYFVLPLFCDKNNVVVKISLPTHCTQSLSPPKLDRKFGPWLWKCCELLPWYRTANCCCGSGRAI